MPDEIGEARGGVRDELGSHPTQPEQSAAAHHASEMPLSHGKPGKCCEAPSGIIVLSKYADFKFVIFGSIGRSQKEG